MLEERVGSARAETGAETVELWIAGSASDRALAGLEALAIEVHTSGFKGVDTAD